MKERANSDSTPRRFAHIKPQGLRPPISGPRRFFLKWELFFTEGGLWMLGMENHFPKQNQIRLEEKNDSETHSCDGRGRFHRPPSCVPFEGRGQLGPRGGHQMSRVQIVVRR